MSFGQERDGYHDDANAKALHDWRDWAQTVFLGGGIPTLSDRELQQAICARCDDDVDTVKRRVLAWIEEWHHAISDPSALAELQAIVKVVT